MLSIWSKTLLFGKDLDTFLLEQGKNTLNTKTNKGCNVTISYLRTKAQVEPFRI